MPKMKFIVVAAALAIMFVGGWRIGACEVTNLEFQEDLHDIAAQAGTRIGYNALRSDDDFRDAVIRKAREYGIDLKPSQVTVERQDSRSSAPMYIAADYSVPVELPRYSLVLHFSPTSEKRVF
jgi:hypothetical protein